MEKSNIEVIEIKKAINVEAEILFYYISFLFCMAMLILSHPFWFYSALVMALMTFIKSRARNLEYNKWQ